MRKKTACFGWYGRAVSIWFDRPKAKLRQLASGQNPSALHESCNAETGFKRHGSVVGIVLRVIVGFYGLGV